MSGRIKPHLENNQNPGMNENYYDDAGNLIETKRTDVASSSQVADELFYTTYYYDSLGRLITEFNQASQAKDYRFDSRGNMVAMADAKGAHSQGRLLHRRSGDRDSFWCNDFGNVTQYFYDALNRRIREDKIMTATACGDGTHIGASTTGASATTPPRYPPGRGRWQDFRYLCAFPQWSNEFSYG